MGRKTGRGAEAEPTGEMCRAGGKAIDGYPAGDYEMMAYSAFKAMVLAAPEPVRSQLVKALQGLTAL